MILALVAALLLVNAVYCVLKIWEDWRAGRPAMAAIGVVGLVGVYALVGWMAYDFSHSFSEAMAITYGR